MGYPAPIMASRDELKVLIDQLPGDKLDLARMNLESILHPPAPNPRIEQFRRRSEEFQKQLPERLLQLQAGSDPSAIRGFGMVGGTRILGVDRREAYGQHGYSWQEDRAHGTHRLILHAGVRSISSSDYRSQRMNSSCVTSRKLCGRSRCQAEVRVSRRRGRGTVVT